MATPNSRVPVRIARGTKADLDAAILDLYEGEICYATDENKTYVVEGGALVYAAAIDSNATTGGTGSSTIGNIVQISQANYDALGTPDANTFYVIV